MINFILWRFFAYRTLDRNSFCSWFAIEERHDRRDHLVGSLLHQPMTGTLPTVPDTLVATSFAWSIRNVPDAFSTREGQERHVQLRC
jgi:hypothetical protein